MIELTLKLGISKGFISTKQLKLTENSIIKIKVDATICDRLILYLNGKPFTLEDNVVEIKAQSFIDGVNTVEIVSERGKQWRCQSLYVNWYDEREATIDTELQELMSRIRILEERSYEAFRQETIELVQTLKEKVFEQGKALVASKTANETLTTAYNGAIEVINNLAERVGALEKHYDPTLIKI